MARRRYVERYVTRRRAVLLGILLCVLPTALAVWVIVVNTLAWPVLSLIVFDWAVLVLPSSYLLANEARIAARHEAWGDIRLSVDEEGILFGAKKTFVSWSRMLSADMFVADENGARVLVVTDAEQRLSHRCVNPIKATDALKRFAPPGITRVLRGEAPADRQRPADPPDEA